MKRLFKDRSRTGINASGRRGARKALPHALDVRDLRGIPPSSARNSDIAGAPAARWAETQGHHSSLANTRKMAALAFIQQSSRRHPGDLGRRPHSWIAENETPECSPDRRRPMARRFHTASDAGRGARSLPEDAES